MSTGRNGDVSKGGGVGVDPEATSATPLASVIDVPDGHELTTAGQMIFLGVPAASLAHTESLLLPHPGNVGPSPPLRYNIIAASELISRA